MALALHAQILRLARSGSPERAWSLMGQHGLLDSDNDDKALSLQARLVKDRAKRAAIGAERARLFYQSAQLYAKAAGLSGASYPLINAASLSLFAGKPAQAQRYARQVLDLIESDPEEGETPYWRAATRSEALLLLDQEEGARAALREAIAKQPQAWEDQAATLAQFELILAEKGLDAAWLDAHRPPPSVHFSGIARLAPDTRAVSEAIERYIASERPGFAYGALAAGSDLLFAEAFIAWRDADCPAAELHVVLPLPIDQFRRLSVSAFGDQWLERFDAALGQATSVTVYGLDDPELPLAVEYADLVAMGRAVRNARVLESRAGAITVVGKGENLRPQLASWRDLGRSLTIIEGVRAGQTALRSAPTHQRLQILLWARDADGPAGTPLARRDAHEYLDGHWSLHDDLAEAGMLAKDLADGSEGAQIAIVIAPCNPNDPSVALLQRAAGLAAVAPPGTVVADEATAMALIWTGWCGTIEDLGELLLPSGREPIWSIG